MTSPSPLQVSRFDFDRIGSPVPGGSTRRLRVVQLVDQPEAEGDFHR